MEVGKQKDVRRRRCVECRNWFDPHRAAVSAQRTCSTACRRRRRRDLAKRRRAVKLEHFRRLERSRQQEHRRKAGGECVTAGRSRASLPGGEPSAPACARKCRVRLGLCWNSGTTRRACHAPGWRRNSQRLWGLRADSWDRRGRGVTLSRAGLNFSARCRRGREAAGVGHRHAPVWTGTCPAPILCVSCQAGSR